MLGRGGRIIDATRSNMDIARYSVLIEPPWACPRSDSFGSISSVSHVYCIEENDNDSAGDANYIICIV